MILVSLPYLGLSQDDGAMIIGVLVLGGIVLFQLGDLKELTKRNYKRARRLVIGSRPPKTADLPTFYPSRTDFTVVLTGRKLIQGGTVLSLDDDVGDFTTGDVFIEGDKIVAVGSGLRAVFAYGFPWWGKWEERQPCSRATRLRILALRMWWDRREPGMRSPESEFAWWR